MYIYKATHARHKNVSIIPVGIYADQLPGGEPMNMNRTVKFFSGKTLTISNRYWSPGSLSDPEPTKISGSHGTVGNHERREPRPPVQGEPAVWQC